MQKINAHNLFAKMEEINTCDWCVHIAHKQFLPNNTLLLRSFPTKKQLIKSQQPQIELDPTFMHQYYVVWRGLNKKKSTISQNHQ